MNVPAEGDGIYAALQGQLLDSYVDFSLSTTQPVELQVTTIQKIQFTTNLQNTSIHIASATGQTLCRGIMKSNVYECAADVSLLTNCVVTISQANRSRFNVDFTFATPSPT